MNSQDRLRRELENLGVSPLEFQVLYTIAMRQDIAYTDCGLYLSKDFETGEPISESDEAESCLHRLIQNGLVQVIDDASIEVIIGEIGGRGFDVASIVEGLPSLGSIDLTVRGASEYDRIASHLQRSGLLPENVVGFLRNDATDRPSLLSNSSVHLGVCLAHYLYGMQGFKLTSCTPPTMVDGWFQRWWLYHPVGWELRMTIERP